MPLQTLVLVFVILAFIAIVWRFLPRSDGGARRLPTVIDNSYSMYVLRRVLRRSPDAADPFEDVPIAEPALDEIAYRIGVPGAPPPTAPTRLVASNAPSSAESASAAAEPVASAAPAAALVSAAPGAEVIPDGSVRRRRPARPTGALASQRRWAGAVALAVVAIAVTTLTLRARQLDGGVLSVIGTPAGSADGFVGAGGDDSGDPPAPSDGSTDPPFFTPPQSIEASAATAVTAASTPLPTAAPTLDATLVARPTPNPTRPPGPTPRPTATPDATVKPSPSASAPPSSIPQPTPPPDPSPEPSSS
jgi:hypothetical protein